MNNLSHERTNEQQPDRNRSKVLFFGLHFRYEQPITIRPGDEVRTTCVYDSTSRDLTTRGGSGYLEEMCYGFLTFYPKQAVHRGATFCTSWKTIPICQFELGGNINKHLFCWTILWPVFVNLLKYSMSFEINSQRMQLSLQHTGLVATAFAPIKLWAPLKSI